MIEIADDMVRAQKLKMDGEMGGKALARKGDTPGGFEGRYQVRNTGANGVYVPEFPRQAGEIMCGRKRPTFVPDPSWSLERTY